MPRLEENQKEIKFNRPRTLDREQLEYIGGKALTYGLLLFTAVGVCASVAYMTVQQLRK